MIFPHICLWAVMTEYNTFKILDINLLLQTCISYIQRYSVIKQFFPTSRKPDTCSFLTWFSYTLYIHNKISYMRNKESMLSHFQRFFLNLAICIIFSFILYVYMFIYFCACVRVLSMYMYNCENDRVDLCSIKHPKVWWGYRWNCFSRCEHESM